MIIKCPVRLAARRSLLSADLEAAYGSIVNVVGGTYYVSGTPATASSGQLDYRNFAANAGITNTQKEFSRSNFYLTSHVRQYTPSATVDYYIPVPPGKELSCYSVNIAARAVSSSTNSGTWYIKHIRGSSTTILATLPILNANPVGTNHYITGNSWTEFTLQERDRLILEITDNVTWYDVITNIICTARHVK